MENNKICLKEIYKNIEKSILGHMSINCNHSLENGKYREYIVKDFLMKIIPAKYSITNGFVIDFTGRCSKEMDVIIYDKNYVPPFFDETYAIVPIDAVICVIQVKTTLQQDSFAKSKENLNSIDELKQTSGGIIISAANMKEIPEKRCIAPYKIILSHKRESISNEKLIEQLQNSYLDAIYCIEDILLFKDRDIDGTVTNDINLLREKCKKGQIKEIKENKLFEFSIRLLDKMKLINNAIIINYNQFLEEKNEYVDE